MEIREDKINIRMIDRQKGRISRDWKMEKTRQEKVKRGADGKEREKEKEEELPETGPRGWNRGGGGDGRKGRGTGQM